MANIFHAQREACPFPSHLWDPVIPFLHLGSYPNTVITGVPRARWSCLGCLYEAEPGPQSSWVFRALSWWRRKINPYCLLFHFRVSCSSDCSASWDFVPPFCHQQL